MSYQKDPLIPSISELSSNALKEKFDADLCHATGESVVQYLCGKDTRIELPVDYVGVNSFVKIQNSPLFDETAEETIFLFRIGHDDHTFVIQKVREDNKYKYVIYQSWLGQFKLDWWLGKVSSPGFKFFEDKFIDLREKYGKGKKLNKEELTAFSNELMLNPHLSLAFRCLAFKENSPVLHYFAPGTVQNNILINSLEEIGKCNDFSLDQKKTKARELINALDSYGMYGQLQQEINKRAVEGKSLSYLCAHTNPIAQAITFFSGIFSKTPVVFYSDKVNTIQHIRHTLQERGVCKGFVNRQIKIY